MINQQVLQGQWNELKGKLRNKWGQLSDDDVQRFDGNVDQLIGMIQRKTGEGREVVERFLNDLTAGSSQSVAQAGEAVRQYANRAAKAMEETFPQAADQIRQGYDQATQRVQEGYDDAARRVQDGLRQAEQAVRERPVESLAVMFAAGIVTGISLSLLLRSR